MSTYPETKLALCLLLLCLTALGAGGGFVLAPPALAAETKPMVLPWPPPGNQDKAEIEELRIGFVVETDSLDPAEQATSLMSNLCDLIFDSLFFQTPEGRLEARLATGFSVSEDGLLVKIELREGVRFSDGQPLAAGDVKAAWDRLLRPDPARPLGPTLDLVKECRVLGERSLVLRLKHPQASIGSILALSLHAPRSPLAVKRWGEDFRDHPVGAGPYVLKEWIKGQRLVLERNENYYGPRPTVRRLTWLAVPNPIQRENMLRSGDLDICLQPASANAASIQAQPGLTVRALPGSRIHFLKPDSLQGIFKDRAVRQALNLAIDKESLAQKIPRGAATPLWGPLPPSLGRAEPQAGPNGYDPAGAKALLKKAGFDFSRPLRITVSDVNPYGPSIAKEVRRDLAAVGVRAEIRHLDWATLLIEAGQPPDPSAPTLFLLNWSPPFPDPEAALYGPFHSQGRANPALRQPFYSNPGFDRLMDASRRVLDPDKRAGLLNEAAALLGEDRPWIWLLAERFLVAHSAALKNLVVTTTEKIYPQAVGLD